MTQSSRKDSTGRKSLKEGPHGGAQDEGPCRDQLDDDGELLRSTRCIEKWTQRLSFSSTLSLTTIMAMQSKVDELGGKIMVSNCQGEVFSVSIYAQGYSESGDMAFVIVPKIQAQAKIPRITLHEGWQTQ